MKVVLITGGSRGIGAAVVEKFAKENYAVVLNYNNSEKQALDVASSLVAAGCDVHLYRADVSDSHQVLGMFDWIATYFKKLDVLVNNAGISLTEVFQNITEQQYNAVMNTNVKGAFLCCQKAVELFLKGEGGSIVNVSSIWGLEGASCESVYSVSKHALVGLTRSLAEELAPSHIKVNCICPPIVKTDMCANLSESDIASFCAERKVSVYTPAQVARDVYNLATGDGTGLIVQER